MPTKKDKTKSLTKNQTKNKTAKDESSTIKDNTLPANETILR